MARTTGGRLAQVLIGYAAVALACAAGIYFGARPTIQLQIERTIDGEARGFRALYSRVDPRTFGGIVATRVAVDAERGVAYSLRAPNGAIVVGNVPEYAWDVRATDDSCSSGSRTRHRLGSPGIARSAASCRWTTARGC